MFRQFKRVMALSAVFAGASHVVAATTLVVPVADTNAAGTNNLNAIFGNGANSSFVDQIQYGAAQLSSLPIGSLITGIGFRVFARYGTINTTLNYTNFDIQIGTAANSIANLSRTFASNQGPDTVLVRTGALTITGGSLVGDKAVNPFFTINFTTPYVYTGQDLLITITDTLAAGTVSAIVPLDAVAKNSPSLGEVLASTSSATLPKTGTAGFYAIPVTQLTYSTDVPEPASATLLLGAVAGVGLALRRRRTHTPD